MAPEAAAEAQQPSTSKSKKNRKKKSKAKANGTHDADSKHTSDHEDDGPDNVPDTPVTDRDQQSSILEQKEAAVLPSAADAPNTTTNGLHKDDLSESARAESDKKAESKDDTGARLAAAAKERDELREQVVELRKSLETLQRQHEDKVANLERETAERSQKSRSSTAETEERIAAAARETEEYKERVRKLEEDANHAREEQQEQLVRSFKQDEERQAQQKAASVHEEKLLASERELKEQLSSLQKSLENSEQQRKEEAAATSKQAEEHAARLKVAADTDLQLTAAEREKEDIRKQLSDLRQSHDAALQQHKEEAASLAGVIEEYAARQKLAEQQTAALSQAEQDKEDLRKQLAEAQSSLDIIRQQHVDEVEKLTKENENRSVQIAAVTEVEEKLAKAEKERDELEAQVSKLTETQGDSQQSYEEELRNLRVELEESQNAKEHAQSQHKALLSKVNTIRAQLGERLKADAEDLRLSRARIEELEELDSQHQASNESLQEQVTKLSNDRDERAREVAELRNRANMTQQNWISERDDLIRREALAREELETAKQAMQEWEAIAKEEREVVKGLDDSIAELEDQLGTQKQAYEQAASERDDQSGTVDGLQRALQDIQEARKQELRETVETYQAQLEDLRKQLKLAEDSAKASQSELDTLKQDLEKALPFEKEVKEKNLLIGKLRHEAVILNDHLTKALKYIKRSKPDDTVDKQLITNSLLQFLSLDRSDPKKFQVLHLISAILAWTDEQNESAGLSRPGASHQPINPNHSLRASGPLSPFVRRVSSAVNFGGSSSTTSLPGLTSQMMEGGALGSPRSPGGGKESLSDLWSGFLEREAQEGLAAGGGSRRVSMSSNHSAGARPAMGSPTVSRYALPKMEEGESG